MSAQTRMSPLTAFFLGFFGVGAVGIVCGAVVVVYGLHVVDGKASQILALADGVIAEVPELIESLPDGVNGVLSDRRSPDYAGNVTVRAAWETDGGASTRRPALTITNAGNEVISMLAVRVAALDEHNVPKGEWTEVVATPIALNDDFRGPIYPRQTRHVVLNWKRFRHADGTPESELAPSVEVSELRLWNNPEQKQVADSRR